MKKTKILIAGGGFAGLYAAKYLDKRLARRPDIEVTLISRENFILFTPMLHEVAAGDLSPTDIVNPLRRILRHVNVVQADIQAIDLTTKKIRCVAGVRNMELEFEFDHLLLTIGSETNFFDLQDVRNWAVTMKSLSDAALLRNRMVELLEEASLQKDEATRRELLTFVTAGGGFAGIETTGAVNDFVRETVKFYPSLREETIRVVVVHPGKFLLPELGEELGRYAERKLGERKVEIIKGARVAGYDGSVVKLTDGTSIPATTLIWTAGVKPSAAIESLDYKKERGRLLVNEYLAVPGGQGIMGRRRLRSCSGWLRNERFFSDDRSARFARGDKGGEEHRSRDCGASAEAIRFYHSRTTGDHRSSHRRCDGLWVQVFGFYCLGDVAKHLFSKATGPGQEAPRHDGLDAGSFVWPRDRTDDHFARRPNAKRLASSYSSSTKRGSEDTNQFSNQHQEFMTYG